MQGRRLAEVEPVVGAANRKKFVESVRKRAWEQHNGLYVPRNEGDKKTNWPVCMTCKMDVESVQVEDFSHDTVDIRAKCHNEECVIRLQFPFRITRTEDDDTWHHIQTAINNSCFFDPSIA